MISFLKRYRWLKIVLYLLAVPAGLLLMWVGGWWSAFVARRALELPDTGGHWVEFLVAGFSGIGLLMTGGGLIAASVYSLVVTGCVKRRTDELSPRDRNITTIAVMAGIGLVILAIVVGAFLLLRSSVWPS